MTPSEKNLTSFTKSLSQALLFYEQYKQGLLTEKSFPQVLVHLTDALTQLLTTFHEEEGITSIFNELQQLQKQIKEQKQKVVDATTVFPRKGTLYSADESFALSPISTELIEEAFKKINIFLEYWNKKQA